MNKKERRAQALKKAKQKKIITISVCVSLALVITALIISSLYQQSKNRVYTDGYQTVTLHDDGSFTAALAHEMRTGTYVENVEGDVVIVTFISEDKNVNGSIENDSLTLPAEWDDGHGHSSILILK